MQSRPGAQQTQLAAYGRLSQFGAKSSRCLHDAAQEAGKDPQMPCGCESPVRWYAGSMIGNVGEIVGVLNEGNSQ